MEKPITSEKWKREEVSCFSYWVDGVTNHLSFGKQPISVLCSFMKRKLIKIINKIIFHFLFWSVILAQRGTISVIITGLIRCLLYSFLSSSSLLSLLFSFLLCLILNLNGFIKCLGPNFGTLQSWQENRHIIMLQKHLYYKPRSRPAQTLQTSYPSSTASFPEGVICSRSKSLCMGWGVESLVCIVYRLRWCDLQDPPFLSSSSLYGSTPLPWNAAQWTYHSHMKHHTWAELSVWGEGWPR